MENHIQKAGPVREEKAPARLLLEKMLGPDRVREGAPGRLVRARTALATARDLQGREMGASALLEVDRAGTPRRLFVMDAQHKDGDTLIVDTAMGRYLVTVSKTNKGLDGKGYVFAGGEASVLELKLESAMFVRGEMEEDPLSWGDIAHAGELEGIRDALEGKASALTLEQVLRATFKLNEGSEVRGSVLFGDNAEVEEAAIRVRSDTAVKLMDALRIKGTFSAFLIKGGLASVADISAKFVDVARNPMAFTVEIDGNRYAGVLA